MPKKHTFEEALAQLGKRVANPHESCTQSVAQWELDLWLDMINRLMVQDTTLMKSFDKTIEDEAFVLRWTGSEYKVSKPNIETMKVVPVAILNAWKQRNGVK